MRVWAAHMVFVTILFVSLAARERAAMAPISDASFASAVLRVARSQGLRIREDQASPAGLRTLEFDAPGCSQPVFVITRFATLEDEPIIEAAPKEYSSQHGYLRWYVYVDQKLDTPDARAIFVQRTKYGLLSIFGLTEYSPFGNTFILEVDAPRDCPTVDAIDWRSAWSRKIGTAPN
jgi:hypothetical protein